MLALAGNTSAALRYHYVFDDGTAKDIASGNNGSLTGDASISDGVLSEVTSNPIAGSSQAAATVSSVRCMSIRDADCTILMTGTPPAAQAGGC